MANLVLLQGGEAIPHALGNEPTVIGRLPECAIQLNSNMISRRHAKIEKNDGQFVIEDLGSGNGTFVNGKQISTPVILKHEDRVKLGEILMRFEDEKPAPAVTPGVDSPVDLPTVVGVNFSSDDHETVMGGMADAGGFGVLDVHPEKKLKAILEISRSLAGTVEMQTMLPKILDTLFSIFPYADRGCILLKDTQSGEMVPRAIKHRHDGEDESVRLSRTIVQKVLTEKKGILSADAASDDQFQASESISNLSIRSMMCVPMLSLDGEPTGIINIDTMNPLNQFRPDDLELLLAVAGQAALSYESTRLMSVFLAKQKQDNEMKIASDVQRALLPEVFPQTDGYEFYASYDSAQAVGGDYYDVIELGDDKICLSFGDVAGKGVPGSIIMSRMSSCVQSTMGFTHDVHEAITAINNHMCANAVEGRFVTYVLIVLDIKKHELTLVNAGHMSPMILKIDGSVEEFDEETIGLPVGVLEDYPYEIVQRRIDPGETIVLFTDGVDEAMNSDEELYTLKRMREFIANNTRKADDLGKLLLEDVRKHANGYPQNDDITIMTFGRNPLS